MSLVARCIGRDQPSTRDVHRRPSITRCRLLRPFYEYETCLYRCQSCIAVVQDLNGVRMVWRVGRYLMQCMVTESLPATFIAPVEHEQK